MKTTSPDPSGVNLSKASRCPALAIGLTFWEAQPFVSLAAISKAGWPENSNYPSALYLLVSAVRAYIVKLRKRACCAFLNRNSNEDCSEISGCTCSLQIHSRGPRGRGRFRSPYFAKRNGIAFELDLSEGIDLAIYLGVFEFGTRNALKKLVQPSSGARLLAPILAFHTLLLADAVGPSGQVLAFEPTDFAIQKLRRNLDLNPDLATRVKSYHCFLASNDGAEVPSSIYSSWPLTDAEDLHQKHLGQAMPTEAALARSIDGVLAELGNPTVQLVKMDVDGFKSEVLRGAATLLRDSRPIFMM